MSLLHLTPGAKADLVDAVEWYEAQQVGLGVRFTFAAELALRRIEVIRDSSAVYNDRCRRLRIKPFAYSIIYEVRGEIIAVVAVVHVRRGREQIDRLLRRPE